MFKQFNVKGLFTFIVLFLIVQLTAAQTVIQNTYQKFDQLINQLEKKYQIQFSYKSEWFGMLNFNSAILDFPFNETIDKLESETGFSVFSIDSTLYIFVPVAPELQPLAKTKQSDEIVIGNPLEFGKYTKAEIHGLITDGFNGNPMPGATLFIDKLKLGVTADGKGSFRIVVPVGEYIVRVTFMGYDDNTYIIKLVGNGELNPELLEKSIKLSEVVISAKRPDLNVSGTQMSYVSLDSRSINELPMSIGGSDIIKSITLLPGVQTIGEFGTGFNVRGGRADQNLILLEDVPLFNPSHMFGLTSVVNSDGISNVTLLKAGISAKYGERASSVLDIRFGAENPDITSIKGGIGLIDSRLYLETPIVSKKLSLIVSARSSYSNWLLQKIPDIDLMNSSAQFFDVNTMLTWNLNPSDRISLFTYLSNDKFGFTKSTAYKYGNLLASLKWKHTFSNILYFNLVAGISNYRYSVEESDNAYLREAYKINSSLLYKNIKWNLSWFPFENHSIDLGFNSSFYTIKPGNISPLNFDSVIEKFQMQQEKATENAAYISDNISLTQKLSFEIGT